MNKEEAQKEFVKIIRERNKEAERITEEAKKNGLWQKGLDSNNHLFKEIDAEAKRKIEMLKSQITEI